MAAIKTSSLARTVTKRRIALIQLHRSVDLLVNHHDPISALTLAGAAEEILGKIAKAKGRCNALDETTKFWEGYATLFDKPAPSFKKVAEVSNRLRNELKHNDLGRNLRLQADFVFEAEEMILRALRNYELAFGCMPGSKLVRDWWDNMSL